MTANATVSPDKESEKKKSVAFQSITFQSRSFKSNLPPAQSFGSAGGGGGFFSLGESNIAERAKRLKEERNNKAKMSANKKKEVQTDALANDAGDGDSISKRVSKADSKDDESIISTSAMSFVSRTSTVLSASERAMIREFDSLLIFNQAGETENILHRSLMEGFQALSDTRNRLDGNEEKGDATEEQRKYSATVNFIDPTTKSLPPHPESVTGPSSPKLLASKAAKAANLLQQQSMLSKRTISTGSQASTVSSASTVSPYISNVYENLTHVFENEYASTIRSVQYKNIRTGEFDTIRSLPVQTVLSRTGSTGRTGRTPVKQESPSSLGASSAVLPNDPSEWHTVPFCHVYIAACKNVDHYRSKVRPSLRAFVSQLESSESNTPANQQGGHSADYLIVYIPIGDSGTGKTKTDSNNQGGGGTNKTNANPGRFGFFRQRISGGSNHNTNSTDVQTDDELSSKDSVDSTDERLDMSNHTGLDSEDMEKGAINVLMTFNHLSKSERSLYKKIVTNFPNGKVCVLSQGSLENATNAEESSLAVRVQEWNIFNRLLGQVIVNGFQDRIKRYKIELKRLDAQRAIAATAAKNYVSKGSGNKSSKPNPYAFNLCHFFLVKESMASSYEQMQLPGEALLQYDEFRLYMPDLTDKEESKVRKARRKCRALHEGSSEESITRLADAGDFLQFRRKIRSEHDLTAILDIMRRYLFARELSLLFRMEHPLEILSRCQAFIKVMHSILLRGVSELDEDDQHERRAKAAAWVIQFSWDIYCAIRQYFSSPPAVPQEPNQKRRSFHSDEEISAKLSEILEVSRLFLLRLAEDHPDVLEPFTTRRKNFPKDLQTPWSAWTPCEPTANGNETNTTDPLGFPAAASPNDPTFKRQFVISYKDSLASLAKFEEAYLKICGAIIEARQVAKQLRLAARIYAEVGEYYASKGNLRTAAASFQKIVKIYRMDHWDRCHFWRVFRLAYCQRTTFEPAAYLKTLCSCFSPRSTAVAPKEALAALFEDLQRVIGHPSIGNARYSRLLFIETSLSILTGLDGIQLGRILDQKEVEKRICTVGESFEIPISIKSHLPGSIQLTSLKLFAVTVGTFKSILTNGDAVQEEDAAKILSIDAPIDLNPGKNQFAFQWSPQRPGQYILSTVEILWKEGYFYYDSMDLQESLLSIEVVPNEATHSLSLKPTELVPGHDQEVQIVVDAGSDWITSAKLSLSGANNDDTVLVIPSGDNPNHTELAKNWETDLEPLKPGEKQVISAKVRCADRARGLLPLLDDEDPGAHPRRGLIAKLVSSYSYAPPESVDGVSEDPQQRVQNSIEAFAPVLEKAALSLEFVEMHWLDNFGDQSSEEGRFLLSIVLVSNTLCLFTVDEWVMKMASPIKIVSSGDADLNESLRLHRVAHGDRLSFAFECSMEENGPQSSSFEESRMNLKLCDNDGKKFWIDLELDLDGSCPDLKTHKLKKMRQRSGNKFLQATLTLEKHQGLVGESLAMTFVIDAKSLLGISDESVDCWAYSISCPTGEWFLGGKVSGILESASDTTLSFVGIPIVPGVLERFPTIRVESCGSKVPIEVDCQQPEAFRSMPFTNINAIATPRFEHI